MFFSIIATQNTLITKNKTDSTYNITKDTLLIHTTYNTSLEYNFYHDYFLLFFFDCTLMNLANYNSERGFYLVSSIGIQ